MQQSLQEVLFVSQSRLVLYLSRRCHMCPVYWICSIPFFCDRGIFPRWASCMVQQSNPVNGASFTRAIHIHQLSDLLSSLIRVLKCNAASVAVG
jgi:hypothetical protein